MAETKVVNLEVKTNIDETTKSFDKLGKSIDNAQKTTNNLDATFDEVYGGLKPLTARMGEAEDRLYELGLAGKQATDEYKGLLNAVGNYRRVQIQTDLVVDAAAQTLGQKFGASIQGVTGAFAGVQGAMGLIGVESEGVEKALLRVQSAMALSEGLKGIREAFPAFKNLGDVIKTNVVGAFGSLKTAIMATGIGIFVAAIGVLILNFDKLKNAVSSNTANAQKFVDSTKREGDAARKTAGDFAEYERTLKRLGYTEDEIRKKRGSKLKDAISDTEREIAANKKLYKEQLKNLETVQSFDKFGLNATGRALYGSEEDAKKTRENIGGLRDELTKLKNDLFEFDAKEKEQAEKPDPVVKKYQKRVEVRKEEQQLKFNELEFEKYWNDELQKLTDLEQAKKDAQIQKEKDDTEMLSAFKIQNWEFEAKRQQEIDDKAIADKKKLRQQEVQFTQSSLKLISEFTELMGNRTAKERRKAFNIKKAADLASATIDGTKAVLSTYADTPGGPVIKGVAAGIAGAFSAIQIAKIAKSQFNDGGSGASGGGGNISIGGGASNTQAVTPNFNIVGNNGLNQLNQLKQAPIQAYVVSGQVSTAQALDRNRIRNATF